MLFDSLADDPYHRAAWHYSFCRVCPVHACYLVDACPDCGRRLAWAGADLCRCGRCGGGELRAAPSERVESAALDGLRTILGLLGDGRYAAWADEARRLRPLSDLSDIERVRFLYSLGMDLTVLKGRSLFRSTPGERARELSHVALARGLGACRRWPEALLAGPGDLLGPGGPPGRRLRRYWLSRMVMWVESLPDHMGGEIARTLQNLPVDDFVYLREGRLPSWRD